MSYEPTTWVTGDIITATKLNNIESGVQSVSSSYTPTTWVTGDIITAVKLNNIEQGIANAGGGSSDFSTAEVTMGSVNFMPLPHIKDGDLVYDYPVDEGVYKVPIPSSNGSTIITVSGDMPITATGSATVEHIPFPTASTIVTITGDCTLTYTD